MVKIFNGNTGEDGLASKRAEGDSGDQLRRWRRIERGKENQGVSIRQGFVGVRRKDWSGRL